MENKVNKNIEFAQARANKAHKVITKEIKEMTALLKACDIQIAELQLKIDKVDSTLERTEHEARLVKL